MSESQDRAKLPSLADSTESKGEDSKDGGPVIDVPQAVSKEEEKHSSLDKPAQPPPYEPGNGSSTGMMAQQGSGWTAYAGSPYVPTQPPPRPIATHTSVQNQTTVVQMQPYRVSQARPPPPPTYLGLALFATLCCFWPLGIAAIIKSNEVNKYHGMGNYELARQASEKARSYSRMSIIIGIILSIVVGILFGVISYVS